MIPGNRKSSRAAWILIQLALSLLLPTARSNDEGLAIAAVLADKSALAGAHDIQIRDGLAYLAGKAGSLAIVDVREPAAPKLVWSVCDAAVYEDAETVLPLGGHRLLVGTRDLLLFDMEQPTKTKLLAEVRDRSRVDRVNGFARVGEVVFAAGKSGNIIGIDVSEANSLKVLGSRNLRELDGLASPHDVALSDGLLLVVSPEGFGRSTQSGKLAIYRVVDPETQQPLPADRWSLVGRMEHRGWPAPTGCGRAAASRMWAARWPRTWGVPTISRAACVPSTSACQSSRDWPRVSIFLMPAVPMGSKLRVRLCLPPVDRRSWHLIFPTPRRFGRSAG